MIGSTLLSDFPQPGDLFFDYANGPIGRVVAIIDGGAWSHVRCVTNTMLEPVTYYLPNGVQHGAIATAVEMAELCEKGMRIGYPRSGTRGDIYRLQTPLTPDQLADLRTFFRTNTWRPYGYLRLLEMGWWYMLHRVGLVSLEKVRLHSTGLVCSSFISVAYQTVGIDLRPDLPDQIEGPRHLAESPLLECAIKGYETP